MLTVCFLRGNDLSYVTVSCYCTARIMKKVNIGYTNRLFAEGLELMIKGFEGYELEHSLKNDTIVSFPSLKFNEPKLLIMELDIPKKSDLDLIFSILESHAGLQILLITGHPSPGMAAELIDCGISAYLLKSCIPTDLKSALDKISDGKNYFCSTITAELLVGKNKNQRDEKLALLTQREKEILILLVNNHATCEVAQKLNISENTVKTHKRNIQTKLGFNNIIELLLYAVRNSLVEVGYHDLCLACPYFSNN